MRSPGIKVMQVGQWREAHDAVDNLDMRFKSAMDEALKKEAEYAQRKVKEAFRTSGASNGVKWRQNSQSTLRFKKGTKPLVNSGILRRSIKIHKKGDDYFVGIENSARTKKGGNLARIAAVQEFGHVIVMRVTKKQHGFFMSQLKNFGSGSKRKTSGKRTFKPGSILVIKIPSRSFIKSTKDAHFKEGQSERRIHLRVTRSLGPGWANQVV